MEAEPSCYRISQMIYSFSIGMVSSEMWDCYASLLMDRVRGLLLFKTIQQDGFHCRWEREWFLTSFSELLFRFTSVCRFKIPFEVHY